jgi:hypothetical protein
MSFEEADVAIPPDVSPCQSAPEKRRAAGTFVFALSGAMAGVKRKLDLFGVLVLSFAAANRAA